MFLKYPDDDSSESKHVALKHNWYYMLCCVLTEIWIKLVSYKTQRDDQI